MTARYIMGKCYCTQQKYENDEGYYDATAIGFNQLATLSVLYTRIVGVGMIIQTVPTVGLITI